MAKGTPHNRQRDQHGGIRTVQAARLTGYAVLKEPEVSRDSAFDSLVLDTVAGIANGTAEDPVAICRAVCEVGAKLTGDPESWLTWEVPVPTERKD